MPQSMMEPPPGLQWQLIASIRPYQYEGMRVTVLVLEALECSAPTALALPGKPPSQPSHLAGPHPPNQRCLIHL